MCKIEAINAIDIIELQKVLTSNKLTDLQKVKFIKHNASAIKKIVKEEISKSDFKILMSDRPLIRFRPLKNSFTKRGDNILLAKAIGIKTSDIKKYINSIIDNNFIFKTKQEQENIEKVKSYVYRHGTKTQVLAFLEYELSDVKNTLQILYKTLDDNSGGLASYFSRPIHRMDNITLGKLYKAIDKSLKASYDAGFISNEQLNSTAQWALIRIYQIQNNSKILRAFEAYKDTL